MAINVITTGLSIAKVRQYFRQITHQKLPIHWLDGWLMAVLDCRRTDLLIDDDRILSDDETTQLNQGLARLMTGEPLAYLLGYEYFWDKKFAVNHHTLIPRPDTECLVETVLNLLKDGQMKQGRLLDLGTGTGCIGISLACQLPNWQVLLVDKSPDALAVAQQNCKQHADWVQCCQSDWFLAVDGRFDVIVSNPPYIRNDDTHLADLTHEPIGALVADDDGLSDIKQIIDGATHHLAKNGLLAIEHGYDQGLAVRKLLTTAGFADVFTQKDYGGNDRVTLGRWQND